MWHLNQKLTLQANIPEYLLSVDMIAWGQDYAVLQSDIINYSTK